MSWSSDTAAMTQSSSTRDNASPATTTSSKLENSSSDEDNNSNSNNNGNNTPVEECNSQLGSEEAGGAAEGRTEPPALPPRPPNLSLSGSQMAHPPHAYNTGAISGHQIRNGKCCTNLFSVDKSYTINFAYYDQCSGACKFKCWSKSSFSIFYLFSQI